MVNTSDRPIHVDGVRLDTLGWNIQKITRATAGRRSSDVELPGLDGTIPSLNDPLEAAQFGLDMFVRGTDPDGNVPAAGSRDTMQANLDELVHLFGKRHALLEVTEQTGPGSDSANFIPDPSFELGVNGTTTIGNGWTSPGVPIAANVTYPSPGVSGTKSIRLTNGSVASGRLEQVSPALSPGTYTSSISVMLESRSGSFPPTAAFGQVINVTTAQTFPGAAGENASFINTEAVPGTWYRKSQTFTIPPGPDTQVRIRWYIGSYTVLFDAAQIEPGAMLGAYLDGSLPADGTHSYEWTGAPHASTSIRRPLARRRALTKATDAIVPDLNDSGSSGMFTVAMTIPSGVWEDVASADWFGTAGAASGTSQEVTTLAGATERITDAEFLVNGPATSPRVTDLATGAYVELAGTLAAGARWRVNAATWTSRVDATGVLNLGSADTVGTDVSATTTVGGLKGQTATLLTLTPVRDLGARRVKVALSGGGFTASSMVRFRTRRKYAL